MEISVSTQVGIAFFVGILISTFAAYRTYFRVPTIQRFFWGNSTIRPSLTASLMLSSSFGLNGLMYQILLAYQIGYWAVLVQTLWCAGFLLLAWRITRVSALSTTGTLHGIIACYYTERTGQIAAWLSAASFAMLVGWEVVICVQLFTNLLGGGALTALLWASLILGGAMWYTTSGGIRGDNIANAAGNVIKAVVLLAGTTELLYLIGFNFNAGFKGADSISKIVTWSGFATNLFFSFFWQCADMAVWQVVAATAEEEKGRSTALIANAIAAWIFPGIVGTVIGVALASKAGLTGDTILPSFVSEVSHSPFLSLLLLIAFVMAVLGTVDLYMLSAGQAISWDIIYPATVMRLLEKGKQRSGDEEDSIVIKVARYTLVLTGLAGVALLMCFVFLLHRDVFEAVYFVVVLLMALAPLVLRILFGNPGARYLGGALALSVGFITGAIASFCGLLGIVSRMGGSDTWDTVIFNLAPIIAFGAATIVMWISPILHRRGSQDAAGRASGG